MNDFPGDDGGHGPAFEFAAVKGGVAGFAGTFLYLIGPGTIQRENRNVSRLTGGKLTGFAEDAGGAGREEFDHAHEGNPIRVNQLLESQSDGGFESENSEGGFVKLYVLDRRLVWGVVCGDGVHGAVGEAGKQGFAIFAGGERRIHFEARIVGDVFVDQGEVVGSDFAGDAQTLFLCEADLLERSFRREVSDV